MPLDCKSLKGTLKITAFTIKTLTSINPNKRNIGLVSPEDVENSSKKPLLENMKSAVDKTKNGSAIMSNVPTGSEITEHQDQLSKLMEPFFKEFKSLKESIDSNQRLMGQNYEKLENTLTTQQEGITKKLHQIEMVITNQKAEIVSEINDKVEVNAKNISCILEENKMLKKENDNLKGRLSRIEQIQLSNNILISGIPEQKWEPYETTKQRIYDTFASAMSNVNPNNADTALREATTIEISYCSRIGKY